MPQKRKHTSSSTRRENSLSICAICQDVMDNPSEIATLDTCGHRYHRSCVAQLIIHNNTDIIKCPVCPELLTTEEINGYRLDIAAIEGVEREIIKLANSNRLASASSDRYIREHNAGGGEGNIVVHSNLPHWLYRLLPHWYHRPVRSWVGLGGKHTINKSKRKQNLTRRSKKRHTINKM